MTITWKDHLHAIAWGAVFGAIVFYGFRYGTIA